MRGGLDWDRIESGWKPWHLWGLAVVAAGLAFLNVYKELYSMSAGYADYGLVRYMIQATAHRNPVPFYSLEDHQSHFGRHYYPYLFPVSWLSRIIPAEHLYAWLMTGLLVGAVLGLAVLVRRVTASTTMAVLAGAALLTNVYFRRLLFSLHMEGLQVVCEILAFLAWRARRRWLFVGCLAAALTAREDAPLFVAGLALWLLVADARDRKDRIAAGGVLVLAGAYFAAVYFWIMPAYRPAGSSDLQAAMLMDRWGRGASLREVASNLLARPGDIFHALVNWHTLKLFVGFGLLPLVRPLYAVLVCAPPILMLSLSRLPDYRLFRWYNAALFLGLLAVGVAVGLERILSYKRWASARRRAVARACLLGALVLGAVEPPARRYWLDLWWYGTTLAGRPFPVTDRTWGVITALRSYPWENRSVAAGMYTLPQLPYIPRLSYIRDWRTAHPDLIVYDAATESRITPPDAGCADGPAFERALARAGYFRFELSGGCAIWERRR